MASSIQNIKQNHDDKTLTVTWTDGKELLYPYIWLRENCQCQAMCRNAFDILPMGDTRYKIDVEIVPKSSKVAGSSPSSSQIEVEWSDGHLSQYLSDWLLQYRFENSEPDTVFDPVLQYWGANVGEKLLKRYNFNDIISSDEALLNWMCDLKEIGIAFIEGAPKEESQLNRIGERVYYLQTSLFGPTFKVQTRFNAEGGLNHVVSYHNKFLALHTDFSYTQITPAIVMLHCLQQTPCDGGVSLFSDGFKAAEELKKENPHYFDLLSSSSFEMIDIGEECYGKYNTKSRHPVISLDSQRKVHRIVLSEHARDAMLRIPVSNVLPTYRALKIFREKLYDPANLFKYKMKEGDIICLNNHRVVHGRTGFEVSETTARKLEGAYMDWNEIDSRIRVLRQEMNNK